ncbi:MAG: tetratricopeptide repeat protein [Spirochaetaceae bacterium]|nr:MAG: tetratricopeptide repeat protein [Spirochaetaceae bacterium]
MAALLTAAAAGVAVAQEPPDALQYYRDGNYQRAVQVTLDEIQAMPRNMDAYSVLGWSLLALGRNQDALDYGTRAQSISPFDPRIIHIVGTAHYNLGNNLDALRLFEQYVQIRPNGLQIAPVYYMMGEIFIRFGEYHHADIAITTALYHRATNATWWSRLAFAREQAADYRHALAAYDRALELNPGLQAAVQGRTRVQQQLGN